MASVRALREKIGDEGMAGLQLVIDDAGRGWRDDVLAVTGERFERRLAEEMAALRVDMAREFAAVRTEMAKGSSDLRKEMAVGLAATETSLLKWSFLFWIGQFAAVSAMMAFLLRTIPPR